METICCVLGKLNTHIHYNHQLAARIFPGALLASAHRAAVATAA